MSILKNLRKKKEEPDMKKAHQVIANINKLIEMKLLQVDLSTRKFSLEASLWVGKDQEFKNNWCKSIALYWDAATGQRTDAAELFSVYDLSTDNQVAFYSHINGCYNSVKLGAKGKAHPVDFERLNERS